MADRKDFYVGELVTQAKLDAAFDQLEAADRAQTADSSFTGIYAGLGVVQHAGTPDLTVDVAAGTAYAPGGERMRAAVLTRVNCAADRDGISTAVTLNTESRIVSVIMRPDRLLSAPEIDASNATVYTQRTESYAIEVVQGAQATVPIAPAIPAGSVLLADITLIHNQTQILNASIATTGRRQDAFTLTGSPFAVRTGTAKQAMQDIVTRYNNHVGGSVDTHPAGDIIYGGSGFWADGSTTVATGPVDDAISEIVSDLASTTSGDSGAQRIGVPQDVTVSPTLAAGTLLARLAALRLATNLYYAGGPAWADSSSGPSAGTVEVAIDTIVSTLAASTGSAKVGMAAVGNFTAGTIQAAIAQLAATTSNNDGARRIGTETISGSPESLAGVTTRAQLTELLGHVNNRTRRAQPEAVTGAWTFEDITATSTYRYKYASRTVTRTQTGRMWNGNSGTMDDGEKIVVAGHDTTPQMAVQVLHLPHGQVLNEVKFWHNRFDSVNMPGTAKVKGQVVKKKIDDSSSTVLIGSLTEDPAANTTAYNPHHGFSVSGLSETIDTENYRYYVTFTGEEGTNHQSTTWYGTTTTCTVTSQDEHQG
jgi:hypothetical protein